MEHAIELAKEAFQQGEVPIGAVVVYRNQIIGKGFNKREMNHSPMAHAEIEAITQASQYLKSWNLSECALYVTVEPCPMCAGALIQSQCSSVVYGINEPNSGSLGSIIDLSSLDYNHKIKVTSGILQEECQKLMKDFFKNLRQNKPKVRRITKDTFGDYLNVRKQVFVVEQNVSLDIEIDELDSLEVQNVIHIGAFINNDIVGTSRLIKEGSTLVVGRVAVLKEYRKQGVGAAMMAYAETQALNNGFKYLKLGAQVSAIPFYEKSGYKAEGDIFLDANIEHRNMVKVLKD